MSDRVATLGDRLNVDIEDVAATRPYGDRGGFEIVSVQGGTILCVEFPTSEENEKALHRLLHAMRYRKQRRERSTTVIYQQRRLVGLGAY